MKRRSGILLHPTSLPGSYPTGDFGEAAYRFVDWLAEAGQTLWQVLPLVPPDGNGSPYASHSAFGISSLLLDLKAMDDDGLLCDRDLTHTGDYPRADYGAAHRLKQNLVAHSYGHFLTKQDARLQKEFDAFCKANAWWLDDHALFDALKKEHGGKSWVEWPAEFKRRNLSALVSAQNDLRQEILNEQYAQWLAHRQWLKLKSYVNKKGIRIIGDVPFFVRHDSVDVWINQDQFLLNAVGQPTVTAGSPPDMYSAVGQRWGNPLYNWAVMKKDAFGWWRERIKYSASLFDILRLDHFRGFESLWHIPASAADALLGKWVPTPGKELLAVITKEIPASAIIAEDIGYITKEVEQLRKHFKIAGTKVMQFGFTGRDDNPSLPHTHGVNYAAYTGSHDTAPLKGWLAKAPPDQKKRALAYSGATPEKFSWSLIEKGELSKARWCIIQLQDILNLGNEARMNTPNTPTDNWLWRCANGVLTSKLAKQLRDLTVRSKR